MRTRRFAALLAPPLVLLPLSVAALVSAQQSPPPAGGAGASSARDPVQIAPQIYKVTLDNERVRVLEVTLPKGQVSPLHQHPEYVIYVLEGGKARFKNPDGSSSELEFKSGQTQLRPAESHEVENIGDSDIRVLNIELKSPSGAGGTGGASVAGAAEHRGHEPEAQPAAGTVHEHLVVTPQQEKWVAPPAGLPPGGQAMLLEGDPSKPGPFALRFKAPADYTIPPHWHPADEHVTVLSGTFYMGTGEKVDKGSAVALPEGSYTVMPAKMRHYAYTEGPVTLQLHGTGPWGITYVNESDDPRRK